MIQIAESQNNTKAIAFKDLTEDLQKLLINLQLHDKIIELDYNTGIKLNTTILENKEAYSQAVQYIQNNYKNIIQELIFFLLRQLYELRKPVVSFSDFNSTYNYYSIKQSSISTATPPPSQDAKSSESSEDSGGHSAMDLSALYKWLEEKKWEYCIWISKEDRDHNKDCIGQINPEGVAFQKLVQGLGLTFPNQNLWETIVYAQEGLYWSWAINKNGYIRFWINDNLSWELFFRLLNRKLKKCNLTTQEFQELIECLESNSGKKLFKLETANLVGPREIIEKDFNKACLVYLKAYFEGLYLPVEVKIDKSKGPYEIEFKGAEGPTRRLQDITVRPFETVQSLGQLEFLEESNLEMGAATNELAHDSNEILKDIESDVGTLQQQVMPKQELLSEFSELEGRIFNLDIKTDIQQIELKEHFRDVLKGVKNNSTNLGEAIKLLDKGIQELKDNYKDVIYENTEPIITGLTTIQNEIKNGVKEIKADIQKSADTLKELIDSNFKAMKGQIKNNLYLLLRQLNKLPGLTARELSQELKVSQKTIYSYLKKLQDKQLINSQIKNGGKRKGRPPKLFKIKK